MKDHSISYIKKFEILEVLQFPWQVSELGHRDMQGIITRLAC